MIPALPDAGERIHETSLDRAYRGQEPTHGGGSTLSETTPNRPIPRRARDAVARHPGLMKLEGEALEDFKRRYEAIFSVRLSDAEARELERNLKHLYRTVRRRSAGPTTPPAPIRPPWEPPTDQDAGGAPPQ